MRKTNGILAVAALAVAFLAIGQPAHAFCGAPVLMQSNAQIAANPAWVAGSPYMAEIDPISPKFRGFFWALGSGNVAIGTGNDNGAYASSEWVQRNSSEYAGTTYFYAAYLTGPTGGILNWTTPSVDGCIGGTGACACIIMSDEYNGQGYFAVLGDNPDGQQNYDFSGLTSGIFRLAPTPKPVIQSASREAGTNNLLLSVTVPPLAQGLFQTAGCNCVAGFRVYGITVPRGGQPPVGRDIATDGWQLLATTAGTAQTTTPIGGSAGVRVDCGATNTDVYLATQIVGDSGFSTSLVSQNSTRIECGPQLADPINRPRVPLNRPPQGPTRDGRGR